MRKNQSLTIYKSDLGWHVMITIMLASSSWATNPFYAIYMGMGWLLFYLFMFISRSYVKSEDLRKTILNVMAVLFLILLGNTSFVMFTGQNFHDSNLKLHQNIIAIHLVGTFPFLLFAFRDNKIFRIIKIVIGLLLGACLVYANCRGALIAYGIMLTFMVWLGLVKQVLKIKWVIAACAALIIVLAAGVLTTDKGFTIIQEFEDSNESDRFMMIRNSWWLFQERPILGVGAGNWRTEVYKYGLEGFSYAEKYNTYRVQSSHNIFATILAEIGLSGFICFLIAFLLPLLTIIKNYRKVSTYEWACFLVVLVFLIQGLFFGVLLFFKDWLSPIMLISVFALGQLSQGNALRIEATKKIFINWLFFLAGLVVLLFFVYQSYVNFGMRKVLRSPIPLEEKINYCASQMHGGLNLGYGSLLLPEFIADQSARTEDKERTLNYYETAIELNPYDVNLLYKYAQFLYASNIKINKAEELTLKALDLHPEYYRTLLLISNIYIDNNDLRKAKKYVEQLNTLETRLKLIEERMSMQAKWRSKGLNVKNSAILDEITSLKSKIPSTN